MVNGRSRFVQQVREEATRRLGDTEGQNVTREVETHFDEHIAERVIAGVPENIAEQEMLGRFGEPRRYVRQLAESRHDTRFTRSMREVAFLVAVTLLGYGILRMPLHIVPAMPTIVGYLLLPIFIGASFLGRKVQWRLYASAIVLYLMYYALHTGFDSVQLHPGNNQPYALSRNNMVFWDVLARYGLMESQEEVQLLDQGMKTFVEQKDVNAPVPSELMANGQYIVPLARVMGAVNPRVESPDGPHSAFKIATVTSPLDYEHIERERLAQHQQWQSVPFETVSSRAEATARWQKSGKLWRNLRHATIAQCKQDLQTVHDVRSAPPYFDFGKAGSTFLNFAFVATFLLLHSIPALLGRFTFERLRRRRARLSSWGSGGQASSGLIGEGNRGW